MLLVSTAATETPTRKQRFDVDTEKTCTTDAGGLAHDRRCRCRDLVRRGRARERLAREPHGPAQRVLERLSRGPVVEYAGTRDPPRHDDARADHVHADLRRSHSASAGRPYSRWPAGGQ